MLFQKLIFLLIIDILQNLTEAEDEAVIQINKLQEQYWSQFLTDNFPNFPIEDAPNLNAFDRIIILFNQEYPEFFASVDALNQQCRNETNLTCFDAYMDDEEEITSTAMDDDLNYTKTLVTQTDFTAGFELAFSSLWHSKLPCFDTEGISAFNEGDRGILRKCKWKGKDIPCSGIFTTFPTDWGMCCSFNMKAADEIFADSQFLSLVSQLQAEDISTSFENSTLPDWFTSRNEPTAQPGKNMGLEVVLDAHSNIVESLSVSSDFEGLTGLITDSWSFPLSDLRGFHIETGHSNLVAISAVKIDADDDLKDLNPATRKCLYPDEIGNMKLFKSYSQANCFLECNLDFAQKELANEGSQICSPWFFPFLNENFKMCDPFQTGVVWDKIQNVPSEECIHCLPDCIRTIYDQKVTTQPFRQCDERNLDLTNFCSLDTESRELPKIWARQVIENFMATKGKIPLYLSNLESSKRIIKESYILPKFFEGLSKDYDAFEKDIAVLKVFFDSSTVIQFKSELRQSWIDYFAAVGGALGLCIGLSLMTIVEIFWLCFRIVVLVRKTKPNEVLDFHGN